ncbi:hypothetical protein [Actinokineospora pegani]|uniref:hypothetical protein n=1 Tax=Actinokineospora pegani TaxID=2654637 RepID=UPI0012EA3EB7|nr:hypothetical protein [Actinokineospora pegani]
MTPLSFDRLSWVVPVGVVFGGLVSLTLEGVVAVLAAVRVGCWWLRRGVAAA